MKKLLPYVVICILIALLVIIILSFNGNESLQPEAEPKAQPDNVAEAHQKSESQDIEPESSDIEALVPGSPEWWREGYKTPMDFYGLVLDQEGNPVSAANIRISWNEGDGDNEVVTTTSNDSGRFSFLGHHGLNLRVDVKKEGYYQVFTDDGSKQNLDFFVPGGEPDNDGNPNDPTIFRLKKKGEGVELIQSEYSGKLPQSGEANIDLLTGRLSLHGQLELSLERLSQERHFPWKAKLAIKDGGFVKADDQFMHEAPEAGYVKELNWSFPLQENGRAESYIIKENYYVKFGSPEKYGRIMIYLKAHSSHLSLEAWVNPDGDRNLEPKSK